jgi:tyrosyl-tRNA synthetase
MENKAIDELLTRGVEEIIIEESFRKRIESGQKLRIKFGIDPTGSDLHLGHTVSLKKLKQFQDLGHQIVLIIGDFTATIGDPSARKDARKLLSIEQVKENMRNYLKQIGKILDLRKTEIHYNSEWYDKKDTLFFFELSSKVSVQRVLKRDDFQKRISQDQDVNMLETLYPFSKDMIQFVLSPILRLVELIKNLIY